MSHHDWNRTDVFRSDPDCEDLSHHLQLKARLTNLIVGVQTGHMNMDFLIDGLREIAQHVHGIKHIDSLRATIHHRHLMLDLVSVTDAVRFEGTRCNDLLYCLRLVQASVDGLHNVFKETLSPIHWNMYREEDSTIASEVFGIPEILETVLTYCTWAEILDAQETCKGMRDIINASPRLQIRLSLQPAAETSPRRFPFEHNFLRGFDCRLDESYNYRTNTLKHNVFASICGDVSTDSVYLQRVGQRLQDMFICQPPINRLLARVRCDRGHDGYAVDDLNEEIHLYSATGLKIADLYGLAERFAYLHRGCVDSSDHRGSKFARKMFVQVTFSGSTSKAEWHEAAAATSRIWKRIKEESRGVKWHFAEPKYDGYASTIAVNDASHGNGGLDDGYESDGDSYPESIGGSYQLGDDEDDYPSLHFSDYESLDDAEQGGYSQDDGESNRETDDDSHHESDDASNSGDEMGSGSALPNADDADDRDGGFYDAGAEVDEKKLAAAMYDSY